MHRRFDSPPSFNRQNSSGRGFRSWVDSGGSSPEDAASPPESGEICRAADNKEYSRSLSMRRQEMSNGWTREPVKMKGKPRERKDGIEADERKLPGRRADQRDRKAEEYKSNWPDDPNPSYYVEQRSGRNNLRGTPGIPSRNRDVSLNSSSNHTSEEEDSDPPTASRADSNRELTPSPLTPTEHGVVANSSRRVRGRRNSGWEESGKSSRKGDVMGDPSDFQSESHDDSQWEREGKEGNAGSVTAPCRKGVSSRGGGQTDGMSIMHVPEGLGKTAMVQCLIIRNRKGANRLFPQYELYYEKKNQLMLVAAKQHSNRTSNYHIFDMSRGVVGGAKLNKKCGNYMGKFRSNFSHTENVAVAKDQTRFELGASVYEKPSMVEHMTKGSRPRSLVCLVPRVGDDGAPIPISTDFGMVERYKSDTNVAAHMHVLPCKKPVYEGGAHRLHFGGRVKLASVKNFQLVCQEKPDLVVCQFGKVSDDEFHLDFREPLTAFQAFCFALGQFNF